VEQAFGMSKSDLRARPVFHYTQEEAIRAHVLVCFMALMMGKSTLRSKLAGRYSRSGKSFGWFMKLISVMSEPERCTYCRWIPVI
jgi:hypothetical protein